MYVKAGTEIRIDAWGAVSGVCTVRTISGFPPVCTVVATQYQALNRVEFAQDPPDGAVAYHSIYNNASGGGSSFSETTIDSRLSGAAGTTPTGRILTPTALGTWNWGVTLISSPTTCNFPTSFPGADIDIHVLDCRPTFWKDAWGNVKHVASETIKVYVPPGMSAFNGPLDDAILDWNTVTDTIPGPVGGPHLERVTDDCIDEGATCVRVIEGTIPAQACAEVQMSTNANSGGVPDFATTVKLQTGYQTTGSWRDAQPDRLRRTAAHELSHLYGLFHPPLDPVDSSNRRCESANDGVSLDNVLTSCLNDIPASEYALTPNDKVPPTETVYGDNPQTSCDFPTP